MDKTEGRPLHIDLKSILRNRIKGWKRILIPGLLVSQLERIIHQDELNELLEVAYPKRGHEFSERILEHLGIKIETIGLENLKKDKAYVFASNHPLGGLDGIALVGVLGAKYGDENLRVLVNDMLMHVEPLKDVFLPVNKYGSQGKASAKLINEAYEDKKQIVTFPAGLVSRLNDREDIRDLEWQKAFASKALAYDRDIVPVFFDALNSPGFYRFARRRKKSGLKINIEQALLPGEIMKSKGNHFRIFFGEPVSIKVVKELGIKAQELCEKIREESDKLKFLSEASDQK